MTVEYFLFLILVGILFAGYLYNYMGKHRTGNTDLSPEVPSNKLPPGVSQNENVNFLRGPGAYNFDVVGESHYQFSLKSICGPPTEEGEDRQVLARLFLEDSNPHDKFAVRIEIDGLTVGYMSRERARSFRQRLKEANIPDNGLDLACYATIRGGWDRGGGDRGHYGVWLDIPIEE